MLVIISDLHFCDGTANPKNVAPSAFRLLLDEIYENARRVAAKSLDLLFLGDVFDLLRTERWFEDAAGTVVPLARRPWASADALDGLRPDAATLDHALAIANEVATANADALRILRGEDGAAPPCPVRRLFLPGNHDRLYLFDDRIRACVHKALGIADERGLASEGIGAHQAVLPRYGVVARHGHEWDAWNFERHSPGRLPSSYGPDDYVCAPIGDPITTELVARLPYELYRRLAASPAFRGTPELDHVNARMQRIEDVRPLVSSFHWVFYEAGRLDGQIALDQSRVLRAALRDTVRVLASDFLRLEFYRAWHERHHRALRADAAGVLRAVLDALLVIDVDAVARLAGIYERLRGADEPHDNCQAGAALEDLGALGPSGMRYVVYGHTHNPLQLALRAGRTHDIYLNSGTWRAREFLTRDAQGFVGWEMLSYLAFYSTDEATDGSAREGPGFEAWSGTRRRCATASP